MKLARVVGNVVSTIKHKDHEGLKLLIIEEIEPSGKPCGKQQIAVDAACAGEGDYVIVSVDGGASRMILGGGRQVVDWVVVGVLDSLTLNG
jgi:microcompartment protein CcmK/EutM